MLKKLFAAVLAAAGFAALDAAEQLQITANFAGDNDARIEILGKSPNVRASKESNGFIDKKKAGRAHRFYVVKNLDGKFEVVLKLRLTGDGNFCFSAIGWGPKKGEYTWFDCLSLEINGEKYIPGSNNKPVVFSRWKRLTADIAISDTEEITMKAVFRKVDAERAAKLEAAAKKKSAKK